MTVMLTPEMERLVSERLSSGLYNSATEVVQEALQLLSERDVLDKLRHDEFRREIAIGIDQADRGELAPLDIEAIMAKGRTLLAAKHG